MQAEGNAKMSSIYEADTEYVAPLSNLIIGVNPGMENPNSVVMGHSGRRLSFSFGLRIIERLGCSTYCEPLKDILRKNGGRTKIIGHRGTCLMTIF